MQRRDQLKLTDEAKETARALVAAWDQKIIRQRIVFQEIREIGNPDAELVPIDGVSGTFSIPNIGGLTELRQHGLINLSEPRSRQYAEEYTLTLLEALRDVVQNDFTQYRDVPITIGTFINGSLTMAEGAVFSSSAYGDVTVTFQTLPDELLKLLGTDALRPEIASAITALKGADEPTRMEKAGKVIEELGRVLAHLSNTGGALAAIALIARMLSGGGL